MDLPPRLRFKLDKLKSYLRSAVAEKEPSYDTSHRMCPACRALIDRGAGKCPHCGASLKAPRAREGTAPGRVMGGLIPVPSTATSALVAANIALFGISLYLTQEAGSAGSSGSEFAGISRIVLVRLGAVYRPFVQDGEWWRLVTAVFLHGGLIHIGFNLWCLFDLGPTVESLFTTQKFIFLYLATGVAGFFLTYEMGTGLTIGASGAILGLIGVLIGASFHHGRLGKDYRGQLWKWVIYIAIIGLIPGMGIDNYAHAGGLVSGIVLGYAIPEGEPDTRAEDNLWSAVAVFCVIIIAGSFALMALQLNRPLQ
ncbi:MAG TPA: rhomboid family intramembrane serine protease [Terriglobia bacterium]|nr:rhomboid family intramembrane serine protease [Terriglobia bacterium]